MVAAALLWVLVALLCWFLFLSILYFLSCFIVEVTVNCKNSIAARKAAKGKAIDLKKAASVRAKEMRHRQEAIQNLAVNPLLQHQLVTAIFCAPSSCFVIFCYLLCLCLP